MSDDATKQKLGHATYNDHLMFECPDLRGNPERFVCHNGCKLRNWRIVRYRWSAFIHDNGEPWTMQGTPEIVDSRKDLDDAREIAQAYVEPGYVVTIMDEHHWKMFTDADYASKQAFCQCVNDWTDGGALCQECKLPRESSE